MDTNNPPCLVKKVRLLDLLQRSEPFVREAAIVGLQSFFQESTDVITSIIQAIRRHKGNPLLLVSSIKDFLPNDDEFSDIIRLFNETDANENDHARHIIYHIQRALSYFPFELIKRNKRLFDFNPELKKLYRVIESRESIQSQPPDILWTSLLDLCKQNKKKFLEPEPASYGNLIIRGLLRHPEKIKHKVIMQLSQEHELNLHLQDFLIRMAGELKLTESILFIFDILNSTEFMFAAHNSSLNALGKIGGDQVLNMIESYWNEQTDLRPEYCKILSKIPADRTEHFLIDCLSKESNKANKTLICQALCRIFSLNGMDAVIDIITKQDYSPQISSLTESVKSVFIYHDYESFPLDDSAKKETPTSVSYARTNPLVQAAREAKRSYRHTLEEQKKERSCCDPKSKKNNVIELRKNTEKEDK